jgi:hypothetical protein
MIILNKKHYIAEGLERICYYHPTNLNLCIKIGKIGVDVKRLDFEVSYYNKISNKYKNYEYEFHTKYYGKIQTNLGIGYVYDIVRDQKSNKISLTLRDYLLTKNSPINDSIIKMALNRLKSCMIRNKIFVGDLRARNLCCKIMNDNSIELIVIDGLGHRDFFPFGDYFTYFAKKKVERRFLKAKLTSLSEQRSFLEKRQSEGQQYI